MCSPLNALQLVTRRFHITRRINFAALPTRRYFNEIEIIGFEPMIHKLLYMVAVCVFINFVLLNDFYFGEQSTAIHAVAFSEIFRSLFVVIKHSCNFFFTVTCAATIADPASFGFFPYKFHNVSSVNFVLLVLNCCYYITYFRFVKHFFELFFQFISCRSLELYVLYHILCVCQEVF